MPILLISSKDQEREPILASRTNLPPTSSYNRTLSNAEAGLPLLLVPSLTPQLPLVVHHRLTGLLLLLLLLIGHDSSLGLLLLLLLKDVSLGDGLATTTFLVRLMSGLGSGLDRPVKEVIVLESFSDKQVSEELAQVRVVGLVVESKRSGIVEVDGKLVGESSGQALGGGGHFCHQHLVTST
jgi:hypothetical protein